MTKKFYLIATKVNKNVIKNIDNEIDEAEFGFLVVVVVFRSST